MNYSMNLMKEIKYFLFGDGVFPHVNDDNFFINMVFDGFKKDNSFVVKAYDGKYKITISKE